MIAAAKAALARAKALVICAGAGMGVDSGLPDFRGPEGFWKAYPPYKKLGLEFMQLANPRWFKTDPEIAWGFYGHRMHLYRDTVPHEGFARLRRSTLPSFVFTSNVDGQFQKAGFSDVAEVHGSIHHTQCRCGIKDASALQVNIDLETMRALQPLPACGVCRQLLRPNVLMFGDGEWESDRTDAQMDRFMAFIERDGLVVIECGAGSAVPTVRHTSEQLQARGATLIRINLRESEGPRGTISLPMGAKDALVALL